MSVADYCAKLELATPLTGRVTNAGGTAAVRDTGAWYARCYDPDEVNAWVRVDNTTLTFADIYLSSESPTATIDIVPGFSYGMEVWALDKTNTVTYGDETSTDGSLVITLNLPNHMSQKDLKKVYDGLEFTLGDGLVAAEAWGYQKPGSSSTSFERIYVEIGEIIRPYPSDSPGRLVPYVYDSTSFKTLNIVAGEGVYLPPSRDFAKTTLPFTVPATSDFIYDLQLSRVYAHLKSIWKIDYYIGETRLFCLGYSSIALEEDTQLDLVGVKTIYVTANPGDATSVSMYGGLVITEPKHESIYEGGTLSDFLRLYSISTTPTATGWKDMSDDTVILNTDVLVDGQSIYPYI